MASAPRDLSGDLATTAFVESSHLFKSLDPGARRDLLQLAAVSTYATGELVSAEEDEGFHLLVNGTAVVLVGGPAGAIETAHLERGAFFGEARALGGAARPCALAARSDVTVVTFPAPVVGAIAERFPNVRRLLEAVHAARERDAAQKLAS